MSIWKRISNTFVTEVLQSFSHFAAVILGNVSSFLRGFNAPRSVFVLRSFTSHYQSTSTDNICLCVTNCLQFIVGLFSFIFVAPFISYCTSLGLSICSVFNDLHIHVIDYTLHFSSKSNALWAKMTIATHCFVSLSKVFFERIHLYVLSLALFLDISYFNSLF